MFLSSQNDLNLRAYCDADWAACQDSRKSLTGYCIFLDFSLVLWKTKKQTTVSRSSAEAEYRSMASTVCELKWLSYLLHDFGINVSLPISLYCDNNVALHITVNPVFHERTKYLEIDRHLVRHHLNEGFIQPQFVPSKQQLANIFTKSLSFLQFDFLLSKFELVDFHQSPP